jgi:protein-tyrosine phosphatase
VGLLSLIPSRADDIRGTRSRIIDTVIDLHCHVLPHIDDGPRTIEGSLALARAATAAGITTVVATPHVSMRYPTRAASIARGVEELLGRLGEEGIALEVLPGAEIAMTQIVDIQPDELGALELGGGGWLLVEPPFATGPSDLDAILRGFEGLGHRILLAHPERCSAFHRDPAMLERIVQRGVLVSVTAGSLEGRFGDTVRRFALELAQAGLMHNVVSDAHDHVHRPPGLADALARTGLAPLADWLTEEVPGAILAGSEIPPRPQAAIAITIDPPRRSRWRRLGL